MDHWDRGRNLRMDVALPRAIKSVTINLRRRLYSNRHCNLGQITNYLTTDGVPNILQRPFPNKYLDDHIILRLLPSTHPYIPVLQGKNKYRASTNAIRLLARKFVLEEDAKLSIEKVITIPGKETANYNSITSNDKLVIKWQNCNENGVLHDKDAHVERVHRVGQMDTSSPVISHILNPVKNELASEIDYSPRQRPVPRIIRGIFIFEFNQDNSRILVHTIDNVEMVDFDKKVQTDTLASV